MNLNEFPGIHHAIQKSKSGATSLLAFQINKSLLSVTLSKKLNMCQVIIPLRFLSKIVL